MPSGASAAIVSYEVSQGTTVTFRPRRSSERTMLRLWPQSRTTTCAPSGSPVVSIARDRGLGDGVVLGGELRQPGARHQLLVAQPAPVRHDHAAQEATVAQVAGERARIDPLDAGDVVLAQIRLEGADRAPVARLVAVFADDHAARPGAERLVIGGGDAVIADQRVGEADDLPVERRIGRHLLIAGHRSGEDDLAAHLDRCAE